MTIRQMMRRLHVFLLLSAVLTVSGFVPATRSLVAIGGTKRGANTPSTIATTQLFEQKFDASKSGTKRERLDRLAELEEDMIETDKSTVLKGLGAFVALIVLLLIGAAASGVLDPVMNSGY